MVNIDPWGSGEIKNYDKLMKDLGVGRFDKFVKDLPDSPIFMKRGLVYGEKGFDVILKSITEKKKFAMLTGLMPSGKFHLGHKMLAEQMIYYQKLGAECYIVVADLESYLTRGVSLKEAQKIAIEEYLLNYIALGLKPQKCKFYFQSEGTVEYHRFSKLVAGKTTMNELGDIYGDINPGKMVSVFTQVADIFYPQLDGGSKPVIVPVGFDQLPHINFSRDVGKKIHDIKLFPPSATFHKFVVGLNGGKMSSSVPSSYIALTDTPKEVEKKIGKHAFSGGQDTVEKHRKLGGNPDVDVSFQYLYYFFEPDDKKIDKIYNDYKSGKLLSGELKQILIEKICKFLVEHQKKREKARKMIGKFVQE